jgi:drug/metabolite transporter (DMT)-like permease
MVATIIWSGNFIVARGLAPAIQPATLSTLRWGTALVALLPLALVSAWRQTKGAVVLNADGTLTYIPGPRFKGSDSFTYQISSGIASASATVKVQLATTSRGKPAK